MLETLNSVIYRANNVARQVAATVVESRTEFYHELINVRGFDNFSPIAGKYRVSCLRVLTAKSMSTQSALGAISPTCAAPAEDVQPTSSPGPSA